MSLFWSSNFSKAKGNTCEHCSEFHGTKVRVYQSEQDFIASKEYGGGDVLKDDKQGAMYAVWAGKNNVSHNAQNYWICIPMHPNCACSWREISLADDKVDWFANITEEEMEKYTTKQE